MEEEKIYTQEFFLRKNRKIEGYSDIGLSIEASCKLIEYDDKFYNQEVLIRFCMQLIEEKIIESTISLSTSKLATYKNNGLSKPQIKEASEIDRVLKKALNSRCLEIINSEGIRTKEGKDKIIVKYKRIEGEKKNYQDPKSVKNRVFRKHGLVDIIDSEPSEQLGPVLKDATELRILQSCLYGWEDKWEEKIKAGIENGNLSKIKFLLTQPYSQTAQIRAHTINKGHENPVIAFNQRVKTIIDQIINFSKKYVNPDKKYNGKLVQIDIKLYYNPSPISIYQCLDEKEENITTFFGIFWNDISSRVTQHFKIQGNDGDLIQRVNNNFNSIWNNNFVEENFPLDWQKVNLYKKNITINVDQNNREQFTLMDRSFLLNSFSNVHKSNPDWTSFICHYHNKDNKKRSFLLDIDTNKGISRIRETINENLYYGQFYSLGRSYSVIAHTTRNKNPDRIIYINFFGSSERLKDTNRFLFGIYNNSEVNTSFPYAQLMMLERIEYVKTIQKDFNKENESSLTAFQEYSHSIREKKIDIEYEESALIGNEYHRGNYTLSLSPQSREAFYKRLSQEINRAEHEIIFLGHGPNHFPQGNKNLMFKYFESHKNLVKKGVQIYRVLLKKEVSSIFKEQLIQIKNNAEIGSNYRVFLSKVNIPIIVDLVMIDFDEESRTAILTYTKTREILGTAVTYPIKMDVIKDKYEIIRSFMNTCNEYLNLENDLIEELITGDDIDQKLKVID